MYPEDKPVEGAYVLLKDAYGKEWDGYTNADGICVLNANIDNTKPVSLEVKKTGYKKETKTITPYIWSNDGYAFGFNNQNNILRKINTDEMYMVYSDGDSVVYGYSSDFGKYWLLEKIGRGVNPTIVKTMDGLIAMWNNPTNTYIEYAVLTSPWIPGEDFPVLRSSEPILRSAWSNDNKYGAYIGHRWLNVDRGDLLFGKWNDSDIENLIIDTVFDFEGNDGAIPMASPLASPFYIYDEETYISGCISTDWELVSRWWDKRIGTWKEKFRLSPIGQKAMNPSVDYDNQVTTFIWEVDNNGTTEIWRSGMEYGEISVTEGMNKYPISKNVVQSSYINNYLSLIHI